MHGQALRLLLEHDHGVWFSDRDFVAKVVDDALPGPEGHPVQVNFTRLAALLDEARRAPEWTYRHGRAASAVLWLVCEMVGGRLLELAYEGDEKTERLITTVFAELFRHQQRPEGPALHDR